MTIPHANADFEDHDDDEAPTSLDLVNPFKSSIGSCAQAIHSPADSSDDLAIAHELPVTPRATQLTIDPPTTIVRRGYFRELPPGTIVGENYEIETRLGAGAMGEVYAARHIRLGKRVAIKVIIPRLSGDNTASERFLMEARALAQIQHPSIVAVEHVGELADGRAYFVMEYLHGESLSELLERGPLPLRESLRILDQMARGLEAAHGSGIIHRDLKPDNTFLIHLPGEEPAVKLLDFGLAKLAATNLDQRAERSASGIAIGTPLYMSPEQARGPDVDPRTDIYALGCIAYELILGARPFPQALSTPEIYVAHLHGIPDRPREIWPAIPPLLDRTLFAMLAKDPARRPTLTQIRSVVLALQASTPAHQIPQKKTTRRAALLMFAIAALATGTAIGGVIGTSISRKHPHTTPAVQAPPSQSPPPAPPAPPMAASPAPISTTTPVGHANYDTRTHAQRSPPPRTKPPALQPPSTASDATDTPPPAISPHQTLNPFARY